MIHSGPSCRIYDCNAGPLREGLCGRHWLLSRSFPSALEDLEDGVYEQCDVCGGECNGCIACMDEGVVEHDCG